MGGGNLLLIRTKSRAVGAVGRGGAKGRGQCEMSSRETPKTAQHLKLNLGRRCGAEKTREALAQIP